MIRHLAPAALLALGTTAATAIAQTPAVPAAHPLGPIVATAAEAFGSLQAIRALPGGKVLVNDPGKRRLLMFDSTLSSFSVVADSTEATATAYSGRIAGLIPFRGDSTLFVDPQSLSMLVIDPSGKLGTRVMSVPRPDDANALTGIAFGLPGFDAQGRLVYRQQPRPNFRFNADGPPQAPQMPDSAPILRVDLATRKVDTAAFLKIFAPKMSITQGDNGRMSINSITNPLPLVDDWAVLSDGTIMILRGQEFRADIVGRDGKLVQGPKVAHDWQRMSEEEKVAFLDSTKVVLEKQRADMEARLKAANGDPTKLLAGAGMPGGPAVASAPMIRMEVRVGGGGDGGAPPQRGQAGPNGNNAAITLPPLQLIDAKDLPDYKPPFAMGAARADADGNVWVRTIATKPLPGPLYDVIDNQGKLVDRVILPANSAIVGFAPGGTVYLGVRDANGVKLAKAKARPNA